MADGTPCPVRGTAQVDLLLVVGSSVVRLGGVTALVVPHLCVDILVGLPLLLRMRAHLLLHPDSPQLVFYDAEEAQHSVALVPLCPAAAASPSGVAAVTPAPASERACDAPPLDRVPDAPVASMDVLREAFANGAGCSGRCALEPSFEAHVRSNASGLSAAEVDELIELLTEHGKVFAKQDDARWSPSNFPLASLAVAPTDVQPRAPWQQSRADMLLMWRDAQDKLASGFFVHTTSPASSPGFVVRSGTRKPRVVYDFRHVNSKRRTNSFMLAPSVHDVQNMATKFPFIVALDLTRSFHQIGVDQATSDAHAVTVLHPDTPERVHVGARGVQFGATLAPAVMQESMMVLIEGAAAEAALAPEDAQATVYIDDTIIAARTARMLLRLLRVLLRRSVWLKLHYNGGKSAFFQARTAILGAIVGRHSIQPSEESVAALQAIPQPVTVRQLRSYLGTCNALSAYISRLADAAAPVHAILAQYSSRASNTRIRWTQPDTAAWLALRATMADPVSLAHFSAGQPCHIWVDASDVGVAGWVLQEVADDADVMRWRLVGLTSATLRPNQRRWGISDRECLALEHVLSTFGHLVEAGTPVFHTDSRALAYMEAASARQVSTPTNAARIWRRLHFLL